MTFPDQIWAFLNSDFGLLFFGFILMTVAGSFLTYWYKRESKKHEVRFIQLHEERAKAIRTLHDMTVALETTLYDLQYSWMPVGIDPIVIEPRAALDKLIEFHDLADKYKVYFTKAQCALIDKLRDVYDSIWDEMESAIMYAEVYAEGQPPEFDVGGELQRYVDVRDNVKMQLQEEFRKILGVE